MSKKSQPNACYACWNVFIIETILETGGSSVNNSLSAIDEYIEIIFVYFSCDQAALRTLLSVRLSVCLWHIFYNVSLIVSSWNFQKWLPLTKVMSMQKVKVRGRRSRSQRSKTQVINFRTVTPVWVHIWQWNNALSLMWHKRDALLLFKVVRQNSRPHGTKKSPILTRICRAFPDCNFEFTNGNEMMHKTWSSIQEVPYWFLRSSIKFQDHTGQKIADFVLNWAFPTVTPVWIHRW